MIRIAICDDEIVFTSQLESILYSLFPYYQYTFSSIDVFISADDLIRAISSEYNLYDILFIDIEMGKISGLDITKHLRFVQKNNHTSIIFVSSYQKYHSQLYDVTPSGFISKPITVEAVKEKLENVLLRIDLLKKSADIFHFKTGSEEYKIEAKDILYFESQARKMILYTNKTHYSFYATIKDLWEQLESHCFLQVHRSFVVNLAHVECFSQKYVKLKSGEQIAIGKKWFDNVYQTILRDWDLIHLLKH